MHIFFSLHAMQKNFLSLIFCLERPIMSLRMLTTLYYTWKRGYKRAPNTLNIAFREGISRRLAQKRRTLFSSSCDGFYCTPDVILRLSWSIPLQHDLELEILTMNLIL